VVKIRNSNFDSQSVSLLKKYPWLFQTRNWNLISTKTGCDFGYEIYSKNWKRYTLAEAKNA
jgi:hypothetical protein